MTSRVGLNLSNLRGDGSRQVGRGVRAGLLDHGVNVVHSWLPRCWPKEGYHERVSCVRPGSVSKVVADNVHIRRDLVSSHIDCLFSLGDTGVPCPGVPQLLMVQQAYLAYSPEALDFRLPVSFRAKLGLMAAYFRLGLSSVTHFTVQTQDMRIRLAERWGIPEGRITVVPSSVDEHVRELLDGRAEESKNPTICYIAAAAPHKNHTVLVPMMASLRHRYPTLRCHLTLESEDVPEFVELAEVFGVKELFVYHGPLERRQALALLKSCHVAVVPSKLESFGVGYYEALALGRPLVVADRPFAREACGGAAHYVHPDDGMGFSEAVAHILAMPSSERESMRKASRNRFDTVCRSWTDIGQRYAELLHELSREGLAYGCTS